MAFAPGPARPCCHLKRERYQNLDCIGIAYEEHVSKELKKRDFRQRYDDIQSLLLYVDCVVYIVLNF